MEKVDRILVHSVCWLHSETVFRDWDRMRNVAYCVVYRGCVGETETGNGCSPDR